MILSRRQLSVPACLSVLREPIPSFLFGRDGWGSAIRILRAVRFSSRSRIRPQLTVGSRLLPGPPEAAMASSPMKKSRSSVPRLPDRCPPGPAPPVKKEGLFATAGRPEPVPPAPPAGPFVAMAVGKTKEGESLPAKPRDAQGARGKQGGRCARVVLDRGISYQASKSPYRCCSEDPSQHTRGFQLRRRPVGIAGLGEVKA